jgi:hypothetical protein
VTALTLLKGGERTPPRGVSSWWSGESRKGAAAGEGFRGSSSSRIAVYFYDDGTDRAFPKHRTDVRNAGRIPERTLQAVCVVIALMGSVLDQPRQGPNLGRACISKWPRPTLARCATSSITNMQTYIETTNESQGQAA